MTLETPDVDAFWLARLTGDATLTGLLAVASAPGNIWRIPAPLGQPWPVVLYGIQPLSAEDRPKAVGVGRLLVQANYQLKAVHESADDDVLLPIAERLDAIAEGATFAAPGGTVLDVIRLGPVDYHEMINGVEYRHLGGMYRVQAHRGA